MSAGHGRCVWPLRRARGTAGRRALQALLGAATIAAAGLVAACGGDQPQEEATSPPQPTAEASAPAEDERGAKDERGAAAGDGAEPGERSEEVEEDDRGAAGPAGCVFTAPPERLAEAVVTIELDGVACGEATVLARAAALGQPAGAKRGHPVASRR